MRHPLSSLESEYRSLMILVPTFIASIFGTIARLIRLKCTKVYVPGEHGLLSLNCTFLGDNDADLFVTAFVQMKIISVTHSRDELKNSL